ncbi:hypothetical protein TRVL_04143 [Trypanosoma vivax]|nr:hypothetical protein TRVL_04143 [Trypanosoma vivax]
MVSNKPASNLSDRGSGTLCVSILVLCTMSHYLRTKLSRVHPFHPFIPHLFFIPRSMLDVFLLLLFSCCCCLLVVFPSLYANAPFTAPRLVKTNPPLRTPTLHTM